MSDAGLRRRRRARPRGRHPARDALRGARLRLDVVERPPGRARARDARRLRRGLGRPRARRRGDGARPPRPDRDQRRHRAPRPRPRSALARRRRRLLEEAADARCARSSRSSATSSPASGSCSPRWARRCARSPAPSYDGAFFNWMSARFAAGAREQVAPRRAGGRPRSRRRSSATSAPRSATTPRSASPRRSPSTATSTTATATTSTGSARPRARSVSPRRTPTTAQEALTEHHEALDVVVTRGLASASLDAMGAVAEAAAPAPA